MEKINFLTFSIGKEYFAINAKHVREVLIHQYYTRLADEETQIAGMVSFKGRKLPVINSQKRLNIQSKKNIPSGTIIIFEYNQFTQKQNIAANVSSIDDILTISSDEISKKKPHQLSQLNYIYGSFRLFERKVQIIDAEKFLNLPSVESTSYQFVNQNCIA